MATATTSAVDHRRIAAELFNEVWRLLDLPERSGEQELEMVHAAHASRHHWGVAGDARNHAIGEWQLSRVYATLRRPEPARYHAEQALRLAREHDLGAFLTACAHEALARAAMMAGDPAAFDAEVAAAEAAGAGIADEEERQVWRSDMDQLVRPDAVPAA